MAHINHETKNKLHLTKTEKKVLTHPRGTTLTLLKKNNRFKSLSKLLSTRLNKMHSIFNLTVNLEAAL